MDIPKRLKKCQLSFVVELDNGMLNWETEDLTWVDTGHSDGVMMFESSVLGRLIQDNKKINDDYAALRAACDELADEIKKMMTEECRGETNLTRIGDDAIAAYNKFIKDNNDE